MEIVFKTSVRIRYVLWLLYALLLGIGVFLVYKDGNYGAVLTLVWMLPLYYWNQIQYRLSDTSLTIKQGGIGWHSNTIPWSAVTNVSTVRKGFKIDYVKSDGKKGFYIVRENYIDDAGEMRKLIEQQVCLNGKVEES
ncbi:MULTISPECIES: hypothetical protein [Bacteroides]|uniref:hypothetical protein n=1 Tax=Bacteroides TaxID=816 RepID=UPI0003370938|nr:MULTISPECIES: hypothetical protein [Bacteroides]UYU44535.1 hypothetical protein KQP70_18605 [Bacteroides salyersiae]CCY47878.1 uncharacterized protein BN523_01242 [Bacteroides sp. CAG:189]